jgi:hypothetical protein
VSATTEIIPFVLTPVPYVKARNVSNGPYRLYQCSSPYLLDPFQAAQGKANARAIVIAAIRAGLLIRPDECSECGARPERPRGSSNPPIEAHHDDYAAPLKIRWLCKRCHSRADRERRLRLHQRSTGDEFAEFLAAIGEYKLPHRYDPVPDPGATGDSVERAIRAIRFAGFRTAKNNSKRQMPLAGLVLSCGHVEAIPASELAALPTCHFCDTCTEIGRQRRERRRARSRS